MEGAYLEEIKNLLEKNITKSWIEEKIESFKRAEGYNDLEEKIVFLNIEADRTLDNEEPFIYHTFQDEETGKEYTTITENIIKEKPVELDSTIITISDYCWCSDQNKERWVPIGYNKSTKHLDLEDVMIKIVNNLKNEISDLDKIPSHTLLINAITIVQNFFCRLVLKVEFKAHQDLLLNLNTHCSNYIRYQFQSVFKNHSNSYINTDTLDFYLDRNQLAGLIHLLIETELLEPLGRKTKQRIGKLDFFEKYFRWTDLETNEKKKLTHLSSEITKIKNSERAEGFHSVFKTIAKTYNTITSPLPKR
jgi:hypothetical protein